MRDIGAGLDAGRTGSDIARDRRGARASARASGTGRAARPRAARDGRVAPLRQRPAAGAAHRDGRSHRRSRSRPTRRPASQSDLAATARALRELHAKWQEVAEAPRHVAQRLWDRFRTATDFIRSRCEGYFAKLREERESTLQKKTAVVDEAEALAASTDWAKAAARFQELQTEWQQTRPGPARGGTRTGAPVPRRVQRVLRAPARGSGRSQEGLDRQPLEEGSAVRARRNAGRIDRLGRGRRRDEAPAGRMEDHRPRSPQQVRGDLESLPRRRRQVLRALPPPPRDHARDEACRTRDARRRTRKPRGIRPSRRPIWAIGCSSCARRGTAACRFRRRA